MKIKRLYLQKPSISVENRIFVACKARQWANGRDNNGVAQFEVIHRHSLLWEEMSTLAQDWLESIWLTRPIAYCCSQFWCFFFQSWARLQCSSPLFGGECLGEIGDDMLRHFFLMEKHRSFSFFIPFIPWKVFQNSVCEKNSSPRLARWATKTPLPSKRL